MRLPLILSLSVLLFLCVVPCVYSNLLINGGFDDNGLSFSPWTLTGAPDQIQVWVASTFNPTDCYQGGQCLSMGPVLTPTGITQTITSNIIPNTDYNFTFWLQKTQDSDSTATVNFTAIAQFDQTTPDIVFTTADSTPFNYTQFSYIITAPAGVSTLTITFLAEDNDGTGVWLLDSVSVNAVISDVLPFIPAGVQGDPQFIGFLGQSYQIHGMDQEVYNLITDETTQLNAQFVFLSHGACPDDKRVSAYCWSHPGSYLNSIGLLQYINSTNNDGSISSTLHSVQLVSGERNVGFSKIVINQEDTLQVGESYEFHSLSIHYNHTHTITITTPLFSYVFMNSDRFINYQIEAQVPLHTLHCHGLLGQTYHNKMYHGGKVKYIEGDVDDYMILNRELLGNEFVYNQFILPSKQ